MLVGSARRGLHSKVEVTDSWVLLGTCVYVKMMCVFVCSFLFVRVRVSVCVSECVCVCVCVRMYMNVYMCAFVFRPAF